MSITKKIIKHISTCWLSLETAVERALKLFNGLRSYFLSEGCTEARFNRLRRVFDDPLSEIYLLFYQSVLPVFNSFNRFLQRDDPCIHLVYEQCEALLRKVLGRFVLPGAIRDAECLSEVDIGLSYQLTDANLFVGFTTRQNLLQLEREGDCVPPESKTCLQGVRKFYMTAVEYIISRFPLTDDVLKHAKFVDFEK